MQNIFETINTAAGATYIAILAIAVACLLIGKTVFNVNYFKLLNKLLGWAVRLFGKLVSRSERKYYRDLTIGRINEKRTKVKLYRKLNDLIIDLGLKRRGCTPYEFIMIVAFACAVISLMAGATVGSRAFGILMYPPIFIGVLCGLYTKANLVHDNRIDAVIEAENIISNNIKGGVVASVRANISLIPEMVRDEFKDFLDNVEQKNFHIVTALTELNNNLGTVADDFIKKCIMFETEEEHGYSGVFRDVVEVNNIKTEIRNEVKRKFETVTTNFVICLIGVGVFLLGFIAVYKILQEFYFGTLIGNLVLAVDALIVVLEFVYITKLRAEEL